MKHLLLILIFASTLSCKNNDKETGATPYSASPSSISTNTNYPKKSIDVSIDQAVLASIYAYRNPKNYHYRLGDVYLWPDGNNQTRQDLSYHIEQFPSSIAAEYLQRTHFCHQEAVLFDISQGKSKPEHLPPVNTLIIHLRIGDVIDGAGDIYAIPVHQIEDYLLESIDDINHHVYVKPLRYYQELIHRIQQEGYAIDQIILVGGFHLPLKSYKKSLQYVSAIKRFFIAAGYTVSTRIDYPADDDFLYMMNAPYFTPSGGGFSRVITRMVELNGGQIILPLSNDEAIDDDH